MLNTKWQGANCFSLVADRRVMLRALDRLHTVIEVNSLPCGAADVLHRASRAKRIREKDTARIAGSEGVLKQQMSSKHDSYGGWASASGFVGENNCLYSKSHLSCRTNQMLTLCQIARNWTEGFAPLLPLFLILPLSHWSSLKYAHKVKRRPCAPIGTLNDIDCAFPIYQIYNNNNINNNYLP